MLFSKNTVRAVQGIHALAGLACGAPTSSDAKLVKSTACNGQTFVYEELAGYGFLPSNARDTTDDTLGGIGSRKLIDTTTGIHNSMRCLL
jgi:hypothetical protein